MKAMKLPVWKGLVAAFLFAVVTVPVVASDAMGVYCIVDKVVLEPADNASNAQIWGTCAVANNEDWYFQAPAKGYFYFAAPRGQEAAARAEWADLKSTAGTGQVVGFAKRYSPVGRLRLANEKPGSPDVYPLNNIGVRKVSDRVVPEVREVAEKLKAAHGR